MDPVSTPKKNKLARTFAKVVHIRALSGISPVDKIQKVKSQEKIVKLDQKPKSTKTLSQAFVSTTNEELKNRKSMEAIAASLFAGVSSIKASYAQMQYAQSPYDAGEIQAADKLVVSQFKSLSELKQSFLKKQFDFSPEKTMGSAEILEQKSLLKTYEMMIKKLESQHRLKDSEVEFLKEKLLESDKQNKSIEKQLNQSGQLYGLENLHLSGLNPSHFTTFLRHTVKSIRSFVRLIIDEMKSARWDINAAANTITPDVVYSRPDHKCFAFESFVCREMFDAFHHPSFSISNDSFPGKSRQRQLFWQKFMELKSIKAKEYLSLNPESVFAKFCRAKYLRLIHPKMESSLFGNLNQRNLVNAGRFPDTPFFASFAEMAKRVWVLHCLAFSFEPEASIFQVSKGCRFSDVYMESLADDVSENAWESEPVVAFTVFPGFRIGKTVLQCQVYLSQVRNGSKS
ncbi:hypothetical protein ACFE04_022519 [Oxalis oulophora]